METKIPKHMASMGRSLVLFLSVNISNDIINIFLKMHGLKIKSNNMNIKYMNITRYDAFFIKNKVWSFVCSATNVIAPIIMNHFSQSNHK